jgi:subtilase family serine protease
MFASLSGLMALLLQVFTLLTPAGSSLPSANSQTGTAPPAAEAVCPAATATQATCLSWVRANSGHQFKAAAAPRAKSLPAGYSPAQLKTAYGVTTSGTGSLAVITAYDNPRLASDLATYDQTFGLPSFPTCTSTAQTSCFSKISQTGSSTRLPVANRSWSVEADLDVELGHAMCPSCRLTIVEANSASITNLLTAVDEAVTIGAHVVSMSWGTGEFSSEISYDSHFANPNVNFVAATGDDGYGVGWPAASGHVLAAGGTHLVLNSSNTRSTETVWSDTGSGCSLYEPKPAWQKDTGCALRTVGDLSADSDPATGAAIYSGYGPYGSGWLVIGGTSLATPVISAFIADAPAVSQSGLLTNLYGALGNSADLYDVTTGANGHCSTAYLCTAEPGYDAPSGVGAPIGLSAL